VADVAPHQVDDRKRRTDALIGVAPEPQPLGARLRNSVSDVLHRGTGELVRRLLGPRVALMRPTGGGHLRIRRGTR
jgi:hypothetical protein